MKKWMLFVVIFVVVLAFPAVAVDYDIELYLVNEYNDVISGSVLAVTNSTGDIVYTGNTNSDGSVDVFSLAENFDNYTFSFSHPEWIINDINNTLLVNVNLTIRGEPLIGSHKLFVLESDDWLSYSFWETRDVETFQNLSLLGFSMNTWKNDTFETENDLEALFSILENYDVVVGPSVITCVPDFDAMIANGYTEYVCDDISDGVPDYLTENVDGRENVLDKHMEGYQNGFWMPIYHGRTHTNTDADTDGWMKALQDGDTDAIQGIENYVIRANASYELKSEYNRENDGTAGYGEQFSYANQNQSIVEGIQHFENLFGFVPRVHSAVPNYRGDNTTLVVLKENGLIGIRNIVAYYNSTGDSTSLSIAEIANDYGVSVLDHGTVEMDWYYNTVEEAKVKVNDSFEAGQAVVDLSHRLNYVSEIFGVSWRDGHLAELDEFLAWMAEEHPTTQYLTSYELHQVQKQGYSIQPWYNKTVVRNYLQVDKEITVGLSDAQTGSGWVGVVIVEDLSTGIKTRIDSSAIIFMAEAGHSYQITDAFANGASCISGDCVSGICLHGICRETSPYCGDAFCDAGESCGTCSFDCGVCSSGPLPQCMDKIDNDGDGKIDMADKGCVARNDNDELGETKEDKKEEKNELKEDTKIENELENVLKKVLEKVEKGKEITINVSNLGIDDGQGVVENSVKTVDIIFAEDTNDVNVQVSSYKPDEEDAVTTAMAVGKMDDDVEVDYDVYQYIEIETDAQIDEATITFEVPREWLGDVEPSEIVLLHFITSTVGESQGEWEELETEFLGEVDGLLIFSAVTDSFSVFAIGVRTISYGLYALALFLMVPCFLLLKKLGGK
jgi:PGF-pre-PGF domain-containing protein